MFVAIWVSSLRFFEGSLRFVGDAPYSVVMLRFLSPGFKLRPAETPKKIGRPAKKVAEGAIGLFEKRDTPLAIRAMRSDKKAPTRETRTQRLNLEKKLRRMYDMQLQKGKFMPGPCSEYDSKKANEQMSCCHPLGALKWGLARYANCTACGLRNCVYQKSEEREENRKDAQHIDALLENALSWDHGL